MLLKGLHLTNDEDDYEDEAVNKLAKKISREVKNIETDKNACSIGISKELFARYVSYTLLELLSKLGKKMNHTLPALPIGNIITFLLTNSVTPLKLGLAVLIQDSKHLVRTYHDFGVSCSYDELLRFNDQLPCQLTKIPNWLESRGL